jgi:aryl-alcohol dehydrogenase-like predicted oxidoreductase
MRTKPLIATKCGRVWDAERQISSRISSASIHAEVEQSLRRLGVDVIDLYQIHWPQPDEDIEEAWGAVAELIRAGKVRFGGVSNFAVPQLRRILPIHPIASLQPPYSMLRRDIEQEILPYCAAERIGVIVYSPLQKGLLTGKITPDWLARLPANDHRRNDANFLEPKLSANLAVVERLKQIAKQRAIPIAQVALAWTLRERAVTAAIVGARKPTQIAETAGAGDLDLTSEELQEIDQALRER